MEIYRDLARQNLENIDSSDLSHFNTTKAEGPNPNLRELWDDINAHGETQKDENISENLLVAQIFLQNVQPEYVLSDDDREATDAIILWIVKSILPSEEFEVAWEEAQLATNEVKRGIFDRFKTARARARLGLSVLESLIRLITIEKIGDPVLVIAALAAFTNPEDPWTPAAASSLAQALLGAFEELKARDNGSLVAFSSDILSRFVKLSFSKTKTPGITAEGRKDAHPVKQPRFDPSIFDKGSKPWKHRDVYIVTVLSWVIQQYTPSDQATIERQFPLLIPAILSLIDDESLPYKARGCKLLNQMLICLEKAKSDILKRTNLDSVFEEALNPCLLSLPSLTPEDQSTHLLQVAYPALFSVIRTRFPSSLPSKQFYRPAPSQRRTEEQESNSRITILTRLLRHSIISSYHHISSPRPSEDTLITSYPHPRLSALLLRQLTTAIAELGIHTVKHLQEIVPILTSTLTNPFGTAYLPLLTDAAHCTRQLVLSAWPRIARWRAEILNGLCGCWLHLKEDEENIRARGGGENEDMTALKQVLKQCVCELKIVLESSSDIDSGGMRETIDVDGECKQLVDGDERLAELF